jgi:hypothetical protein
MKIEIDFRPVEINNLARQKPWYGIRLYPETNSEMAGLEKAIILEQVPVKFQRNSAGDSIHYLIAFEEKTK